MPFVKRHRKYYKYGTEPNATIVGSFARIENGVASGFSSANYLTLPEVFNPQSNTWEQVWSVTTGANTSTTYQRILAQTNVGTAAVSGYDLRVDSGKIVLYVEGIDFRGATVLQDYTHYLIKAQYAGSAYILSYSTDNGASWVEDCNVASTVTGVPDMNVPQYVGIWKSTYNSAPSEQWLGTIDLSQSYININGERWWSGDSYTKVGSWIEDGVVSGFTASNYLLVDKYPTGITSLEMCFKVKATSSTTGAFVGQKANNYKTPQFYMSSSGSHPFEFAISPNGSSWSTITSSFVPTLNKDYWVKGTWDGGTMELLVSEDGETFTSLGTKEVTQVTWTEGIRIGDDAYDDDHWRGSIDLNSSYIKINNKDWWHGTKAYQINVSGGDVWEKWEQPILTSNGVLGGNSFACQMLNNPVNPAYLAFDGNTSTNARITSGASSSSSFTFYNPEPLKISTIIINASGNSNNEYMSAGKLYGSNDNSSWTELLTFSGLSYGDYTLDVNSNKSYKYHKFMPTSLCSAGYWTLAELKITAQKLMATGSIEDAAYYVNHNKLYQLAAVKRSYYKYDYQDWTQPTLTANDSDSTFIVNATSYYSGSSYTYNPWKSFSSSLSWASSAAPSESSPQYFYITTDTPLKISSILMTNVNMAGGDKIAIASGVLQASTDNVDWIDIVSFTNTNNNSGGTWTIEANETEGYLYHRFKITASLGSRVGLGRPTINAQKGVLAEGSKDDYLWYTDKLLSYSPIVRGKRSYYKQDLNQRDTGTYTFTLAKDYTAKMLFVGNGGGGCSSQKDSRWHYSSGGSGACFEGLVRLPADTYTLTIGTLGYGNNYNNTHYWSGGVQSTDSYLTNSAGEELIRVGAGGMGYTSVGGVGGAAGVLTLGTLDIIETKKATDGVYTAGNTSAGSVSAYDGTYSGYGAGTGSQRGQGDVYGIAGIFDLVLETDISDYDWYEDVGTKVY